MKNSVFARRDVYVIGIRGPLPDRAGLCKPVYRRGRGSYIYAFGDEILSTQEYPCRTESHMNSFAEFDVITRLNVTVGVDAPVGVVCISPDTEGAFSKIFPPEWRAGRTPLRIQDQPLSVYIVPLAEAVWWLKDVAVLIWQVMDRVLRATTVASRTATNAERLGWICWEMLTWGIPPTAIRGWRRETMVRIVAARKFQPQRVDLVRLMRIAAKSLGFASTWELGDLVADYIRTGTVKLSQ